MDYSEMNAKADAWFEKLKLLRQDMETNWDLPSPVKDLVDLIIEGCEMTKSNAEEYNKASDLRSRE